MSINYTSIILCVVFVFGVLPSATIGTSWDVIFTPNKTQIHMHTSVEVEFQLIGISRNEIKDINLISDNVEIASVNYTTHSTDEKDNWNNFMVNGIFLGSSNIFVELTRTSSNSIEKSSTFLPVTIIREERIIDHIFTGSVIILVSLLYINFGAALDLGQLNGIIRRPIGPIIGFCSQFLLMPLLSYGLGQLLFPDQAEFRLGLFFTGVSPAGGASNIWTVILNGNINLSITMTTISTFAAFGE